MEYDKDKSTEHRWNAQTDMEEWNVSEAEGLDRRGGRLAARDGFARRPGNLAGSLDEVAHALSVPRRVSLDAT